MQFAHGVALSISARKRSRRVSFFLLAYSRSEKLFWMIERAVSVEAKLSQTGSATASVGGE
jgi:hypothetical protein